MKIDRNGDPPIIIGGRVVLGQAILGALNAGLFFWNQAHPEAHVDGAIVGWLAQPITFFAQVWWVNKFGVTQ